MRRVADIKEPELPTPVLLLPHTRMLLPCGHKHLYPTHSRSLLSLSLSCMVPTACTAMVVTCFPLTGLPNKAERIVLL